MTNNAAWERTGALLDPLSPSTCLVTFKSVLALGCHPHMAFQETTNAAMKMDHEKGRYNFNEGDILE